MEQARNICHHCTSSWLMYKRRDDERGPGGDHAGRLADRLHDDVFEDGALAAGLQPFAAEEDGQDGDGDGRFDGVARPQGHVDARGRKDHDHDQPDRDRPQRHLRSPVVGGNDGLVLLAGLELGVGVARAGACWVFWGGRFPC